MCMIETLEDRRHLSASLVNGDLVVNGDLNRPNLIKVSVTNLGKTGLVYASVNGRMSIFRKLPTNEILVNGGNKNDVIIFNSSRLAGRIYAIGLTGGEGDDVIMGQSDTRIDLNGGTGDDILMGGSANDYLQGDEGDDLLIGGAGNDLLNPDEGDDTVYGGSGNDSILIAPTEHDVIDGGTGFDTIFSYGPNPITSTSKSVELVDYSGSMFG